MSKLIPFSKMELRGEKIKGVFFLNVAGGEKTFLIFESGNVLILPVYRECPVQFGKIADLQEDFNLFLSAIHYEKNILSEMAKRIEDLKNGLDGG